MYKKITRLSYQKAKNRPTQFQRRKIYSS